MDVSGHRIENRTKTPVKYLRSICTSRDYATTACVAIITKRKKIEVHRLAYAKGTATNSWYRLINVVTYEMAIRLSVLILRGGA